MLNSSLPLRPARLPSRRRFTLIELLVVVAIISILASLLLPALARARRYAERTTCGGNQRQLGIATMGYANDMDGAFPQTFEQTVTTDAASKAAFRGLVEQMGDTSSLYCPAYWYSVKPTVFGQRVQIATYGKYQKGGDLIIGYNKWVGSAKLKPLLWSPAYFARYMDKDHQVSGIKTTGDVPTGFMNETAAAGARRTRISLGVSLFVEGSAYGPKARVLASSQPVPPSEIALFSCANNVNSSRGVSYSHSGAGSYNPPIMPVPTQGINEVLLDGHATWYGAQGGDLYHISDGQAGGGAVLVQDDK